MAGSSGGVRVTAVVGVGVIVESSRVARSSKIFAPALLPPTPSGRAHEAASFFMSVTRVEKFVVTSGHGPWLHQFNRRQISRGD
jgi:hypothetical protein